MLDLQNADEIRRLIKEKDLVVVLFSDLSCNVCLAIMPDLKILSQSYPNAIFIASNVVATRALIGEYLIFVYPTIIVYAQGRETKRFERVFAMDAIEETLNRYNTLLFG